METVKIDFSQFAAQMGSIIQQLANVEISMRPIAVEVLGIMHKRIHTDGLDSNGNKIGTYSNAYLRERKARGLGSGTDVIFVLTRKLSNSWTVFRSEKGYAIGFVDQGADGLTAMQKVKYYEDKTGKKILNMTDFEKQYANDRIIEIASIIIQQNTQK